MSTAALNSATASVQELQTDFAAVARKIEEYGHIVITHDGVPSYEMTPIAKPPAAKPLPQPDYMAGSSSNGAFRCLRRRREKIGRASCRERV